MKKCIIVDDVALNIVLAQKMLTSLKLDMSKAVNGQQACDMIRNGYEPDVMILDLMMPIMDGLEATKAIKEKHPNLPIVALTANAFDSDRQLAMQAGCVDFLSKPVSSDLCIKTIRKFLGE